MEKFFGGLLMLIALIVVLLALFSVVKHYVVADTSVASLEHLFDPVLVERENLRLYNRLETV